ncbi:MAG: hypothetical protein KGI89_15795 [Euryarchaeota archaeon]|nr:hypothetical protein [Euryarchaeota archaeon]
MANTATVVTPQQPQTTVEPSGGPFIRHSEPGKGRIYDLTSQAFGGLINQPLTALPGYARAFRLYFKASGGVNGNSTAVATAADAPESAVQLITLWDALGTPIVSGPGFEVLRLIPMFSGGFGLKETSDTHNLPSFSAVATGTSSAGTGNFTFASVIPLEFAAGGYGVLGMADGDVLPKLQIQLAGSASVYTTAPPTAPTLEVRLNADYYWLPAGQDIAPPGLGSSRQWFLQQGNPQPAAATTATVTIPRQGGWLDTMIFICRDSTGARVDAWPSIFRFGLDGIGEISTNLDEIYDDMAVAFGAGATNAGGTAVFTRPTGVIALSRKTSLGRQVLGLLDTMEVALSTSPGTSMTIEGAPWGSGGTGPYTINALLGQIIPSGALIQGLGDFA